MVESTTTPPNNDITLEGFFMSRIVLDDNIQLIPACQLDNVTQGTPEVDRNFNVCKISSSNAKSALQNQVKRPAKSYTKKASPLKTDLELIDLKVCLEKSSEWISRIINPAENDSIYKLCPYDIDTLKGKSCVADKRKSTGIGNPEHENKKLKSSDDFNLKPGESSGSLISQRKIERRRKPRNIQSNECSIITHSRSKRKSKFNTHTEECGTENGENHKQKKCRVTARGNRTIRNDTSGQSKETVNPEKGEVVATKPKKKPKDIGKHPQDLAETSLMSGKSTISYTRSMRKSHELNSNTSLVLRSNRKYCWMLQQCSDDEMDETWEEKPKKKKGPSKKKLEGKKKDEVIKSQSKPEEKKGTANIKNKKKSKDTGRKNIMMKNEKTGGQKKNQKNNKGEENRNLVSQVQEKVVPKPEDCVITAKPGTLKYLQQREEYVKAVAKEAEAEDDFFSAKAFGRKKKVKDLILTDIYDETLSIKTPQGKGQASSDAVITPRTSLLGQWGVSKQSSTVYTPATSSPVLAKSPDKKAVMETLYHQLKAQRGRVQGTRKPRKNNELAFESVLQTSQMSSPIQLPALPEIPECDTSNEDNYFNASDVY